jgi:hypothetical protein
MKKIRVLLACLAIVAAALLVTTEAFSGRDPACTYSQQFYKSGQNYFPTGQLGLHYVCYITPMACTYYQPDPVLQPDNYVPCRQGFYQCINC